MQQAIIFNIYNFLLIILVLTNLVDDRRCVIVYLSLSMDYKFYVLFAIVCSGDSQIYRDTY